jgi:hypothetical protein
MGGRLRKDKEWAVHRTTRMHRYLGRCCNVGWASRYSVRTVISNYSVVRQPEWALAAAVVVVKGSSDLRGWHHPVRPRELQVSHV